MLNQGLVIAANAKDQFDAAAARGEKVVTDLRAQGERAAFDEFLTAHPEWNVVRFKDPTWGGASFVIEQVDASRPRRRP